MDQNIQNPAADQNASPAQEVLATTTVASAPTSLLERHIMRNPRPQGREQLYVRLINAVPSKPVEVNGEVKSKLCITIATEKGQLVDLYPFADSVTGLPNFIPKGGLECAITIQPWKGKQGEEMLGCVAIGINSIVNK